MSDHDRGRWLPVMTASSLDETGVCPAPPSRRRVLTAVLAGTTALLPGRAPARDRAKWRCCGARCITTETGEPTTNRIHTCVKATMACPTDELPAGCTLDCDEIVATCGKCGKSICPARDR